MYAGLFFCIPLFICQMQDENEEAIFTMALTLIPGIGPSKAKNLIAYCGGAQAIFREKKSALLKIPDIGPHTVQAIKSNDFSDQAKKEFDFAQRFGIDVLLYTSTLYPQRLKSCDDSPVYLFKKGSVDLNPKHSISVVGTRAATSYGKQMVQELLEGLQELEPLVVSGLAYGVDIAAHRNALKLSLPTVACLAHGLDRIYPPLHTSVAKEMLNNGGLLTEFPSGTNPDRELFPARNRIIAGLGDCTIVVETDMSGGSIITAHIANSYGREVFAYPGRTLDKHSSGCNNLIRKNIAAIITSPADLMEYMNWGENQNLSKKQRGVQQQLFITLSAEELKLAHMLEKRGRLSIDVLCFESGHNLSFTNQLLLEMEFKGAVRSLPGKMYEIIPGVSLSM
jgi:DNA processing protein